MVDNLYAKMNERSKLIFKNNIYLLLLNLYEKR